MRLLRYLHPRALGVSAAPAAFLLGFAASSFQVFLLREFAVHFRGNELVFGLVMASWLFWGGVGSLAGPRIARRPGAADRLFGAVVLLFPGGLLGLRLSRFVLGTAPGELAGMGEAFVAALAVGLACSLPLGALFPLIAGRPGMDVPRAYAYESLGALAGGLTVSVGLIPYHSNGRGAALVAAGVATASFALSARRGRYLRLAVTLALLAGSYAADVPSQRAHWRPFELVWSHDTPYGRLQWLRTGAQSSLYSDGIPVLTTPDPAAAEAAVHFAMLQAPEAREVLLVGGGADGGLAEILKYPVSSVDHVELDPAILEAAGALLSESGRAVLRDPRVRLHHGDGLKFLQRSRRAFGVILLRLPEPATALINRFYTKEFFELARSRLAPGGVLSFVVPSSEDSIGPDLGRFLATLHATLETVFPEVRVVPGAASVFLASAAPLTLDAATLADRVEERSLSLLSIDRAFLAARLNPVRTERLEAIVRRRPVRLNLDLAPAAYYFHAVLWSSQFRGGGAGLLRFLGTLPVRALLGVPLLAYAALVILLRSRPRRRTLPSSLPVWTMGFTTIVAELAALIAFQSFYGYVYGKLSLLLSAFMGGLFLGAWPRRAHGTQARHGLAGPQTGLLLVVAAFRIALANRAPEPLFYLLLLGLGALGGRLFVTSARSAGPEVRPAGWAYGADLLGSFLGAMGASAILVPLAGILPLFDALVLMNALCLGFVLISRGSTIRA